MNITEIAPKVIEATEATDNPIPTKEFLKELYKAVKPKRKKLVNWARVWRICSPFLTVLITVWIWKLFLFPPQQDIAKIINSKSAIENKLIIENKHLKDQNEAMGQDMYFICGENFALYQAMDKLGLPLARTSLQKAIEDKK